MDATRFPDPVLLEREHGRSPIVVVCEHASAAIPQRYKDLGLSTQDLASHIAWDIGALGVAKALSEALDAALVASQYSRLLVDCNRFVDAEDAFVQHSGGVAIPGNLGLSSGEKQARIIGVHQPLQDAIKGVLDARSNPILVSVHSFTPVFHGHKRAVELGLLADHDDAIAQAMLRRAAEFTDWVTAVNQPYDANSGVSYTLRTHALARGIPHILFEIRQDLIQDAAGQRSAAAKLTPWLRASLADLGWSV